MPHTFFCIDGHTCGNPVRLVAGGAPLLVGKNMSEKRQHFLREFDWIRKGLMFEPRGHDMMSGSMLYPPSNPENDIGILFIETSGCLPMCGHGTIGTVTMGIEQGLIRPKKPGHLRLEVPAGLVLAEYVEVGRKVISVKITNVESYLDQVGLLVESPLGEIKVDVAYGGNFYAIVDVQKNFPGMEHFSADQLISFSQKVRSNINQHFSFQHKKNETIRSCSHVMWTGKVLDDSSTARNAVFYGDKAIDRSPCGTGTSARMAQWYAQGKLKKGEAFIHESIIGSKFIGRIEEVVSWEGMTAIIPSIEGWARMTGFNQIMIDEEDPYPLGFQVI